MKDQLKITEGLGGFTGDLDTGDVWGHPVANAGDLDGDGVIDLIAGAPFDDDGEADTGAFWILYLNSDGTVKSHEKISQTQGGFTGDLDTGDLFSHIAGTVGDLDGNGFVDFVVGSPHDDDGGEDRGSVWILFSEGTQPPSGADVVVVKSDLVDPVAEGADVTYQADVTNIGPDPAVNVTLTDTLPAGVTFVSAVSDQGSCSESAGVVDCSLGDIADGATVSVTIVVTTTGPGVLTNNVTVSSDTTDPDLDNNAASEDTTVTGDEQTEIIVDDLDAGFSTVGTWRTRSSSSYNPWQDQFRFVSSGTGSAQAIFTPDVAVAGSYEVFVWALKSTAGATDTPVTVNYDGGSSTIELDQNGSPATGGAWISLGTYDFASGTTGTIIITNDANGFVLADAVRLVGGTAPPPPPPPSGADVVVVKSDLVDPVAEGADVTYQADVTNIGPDPAVNVTLTDTLPAGVTFVSAVSDQGSCSESAGVVDCSLGDIADGATVSVTIVVTTTGPGVLTNNVTVSSDTTDPDLDNNAASEDTTVTGDEQTEIIVDDLDAGFSTVGTWRTRSSSSYNPWQDQFRFVSSGTGSAQAIFTPDVAVAGSYEVFVWALKSTAGATDTPVTVNYDGGSSTIELDQNGSPATGGAWISLGTYDFASGTTGTIIITNDANGFVLADAVALTTGGAPTTPNT